MNKEQFDQLIRQLENEARKNPESYQFKAWLLAVLGNFYLLLILLFAIGVFSWLISSITTIHIIVAKFIIVTGMLLWVLLKASWMKMETPEGTPIYPQDAPELFAMINGLQHKLMAPQFHQVLITQDFNAGIIQAPRLGIFGWSKNYLLLGLPLMKSLTVEQFKAVLAHEFGHLAKGHSRLSNWIYRQRLRWQRVLGALEENHSLGGLLFKPFLNWFATYFNAYSFPLARANEYEADYMSVRLTSPQAAAQALTNVEIIGSYLSERYWPGIYKQADAIPHPVSPYVGLHQSIATEIDRQSAQSWLAQAMDKPTHSGDTHPSLKDRLHAIGQLPNFAPPKVGQAADRLLGRLQKDLTENLDQFWQKNVSSYWGQRHTEAKESRLQLQAFDQQVKEGQVLSVQDAFKRAMLTERLGDGEGALCQLKALYQQEPHHTLVIFSLGARLLERADVAGVAMVEQAITQDMEYAPLGCELLRDFYQRQGEKEISQSWHQRMLEQFQYREQADRERSFLHLTDQFEAHDLPEENVLAIQKQLNNISEIKSAYLVKKKLSFSQVPCYVIGYRTSGIFNLYSPLRAQQVMTSIQAIHFHHETVVINLDNRNIVFEGKFKHISGAKLVG